MRLNTVPSEAAAEVRVTSSLVLDTLNFFSVLTGDPFYTRHHLEVYEDWSRRLGKPARADIEAAAAAFGSAMLGPRLTLIVSAVPDFDRFPVSALLGRPALIEEHFRGSAYYDAEMWASSADLCGRLAPAARALEEHGFPAYWQRERRPIIDSAIARLNEVAGSYRLWPAVEDLLGWKAQDTGALHLYMCSFAAPHGIRVSGNAYISDARYSPETTLRIAVHESFHPPFGSKRAIPRARALIADPLFQRSFREKKPEYGYNTEHGFLEENIVEAMEAFVSSRTGLLDDPVAYVLLHDEGSHMLSAVLVDAFRAHPRAEGETFLQYFQRITGTLPVGDLSAEYERILHDHAGREP